MLYTSLAISMLREEGARVLCTPTNLIVVPLAMLAVITAVVALHWRRLSLNRYGRRIAGLFPGGLAALLLHRVVAVQLGTPAAHVLVGDLVVMATFYGVIATTEDRWIGVLSLIVLIAAIVGALSTALAAKAFGVAVLLCIAATAVRLIVDRDLHAGPPVDLDEDEAA